MHVAALFPSDIGPTSRRTQLLSRYTIYRRRPADAGPLPEGLRQDTRYFTRHVLRPTKEMVERYLADPSEEAFSQFRAAYLAQLDERWQEDAVPFEKLAEKGLSQDVYLGCSCPTKKNPNLQHCHTWLALEFMQNHFPKLKVVFPKIT